MVDSQVLEACAEQGIPVLVLAGRGESHAVLIPARTAETSAETRLVQFLQSHRWKEEYENWRDAETRREILAAYRAWGLPLADMRPGSAARALTGLAERAAQRRDVQEILANIRAVSVARVIAEFCRFGIRIGDVCRMEPRFSAVPDVAALLGWRHYSDVIEGAECIAGLPAAVAAAAITEKIEAREGARCTGMVQRLLFSAEGDQCLQKQRG